MTSSNNRRGFYLAKLFVLAAIFKLSFTAEVISAENPREVLSTLLEGESSQNVPVIIIPSDNIYEKRNNLNKFKNLMLNKDIPNIAADVGGERDEQLYYIPRINHANSGKRGEIVSFAVPGNRLRYGTSNYRQPSHYGTMRQA